MFNIPCVFDSLCIATNPSCVLGAVANIACLSTLVAQESAALHECHGCHYGAFLCEYTPLLLVNPAFARCHELYFSMLYDIYYNMILLCDANDGLILLFCFSKDTFTGVLLFAVDAPHQSAVPHERLILPDSYRLCIPPTLHLLTASHGQV